MKNTSKALDIAKYNGHLEEIKFTRSSVFFMINIMVIIWGAFLTLIVSRPGFIKEQPTIGSFLMISIVGIFSYIVLFIGRTLRIEKIHWEIISNFEKAYDDKYKFTCYEERAPFKNRIIILYIAMASPALFLSLYARLSEIDFLKNIYTFSILIAIIVINFIYGLSSLTFKPKLKKKFHKSQVIINLFNCLLKMFVRNKIKNSK